MYTVYVITNINDGRQYVGQTTSTNLNLRLSRHFSNAHYQARYRTVNGLWAAMLETERTDWTITALHQCETPGEAAAMETLMIDQLDTFTPAGLNLTVDGRRGHATGPRGKLTPLLASEIRDRYEPRVTPYIQLAAEYGVSEATVIGVVKGRHWKAYNRETA